MPRDEPKIEPEIEHGTGPRVELGSEIGAGTTGRVWTARLLAPLGELPAGVEVAVKALARHAPAAQRAAFEREAEVGGLVDHPHLVHVLYKGEHETGPYLVMRLVPGATLRESLEQSGRPPEPQVRRIGRQLAAGLGALHGAGWIHRDVKPENARLDDNGYAVLLDLGFACPIASGADDARPGSVPYLAPEQISGEPGTAASDVYSLGLVLYELATGQHPFAAEESERARTNEGVLDALRQSVAAPLPSTLDPRLSPFFDALIGTLLAPDPAERPTARELETILAEGEVGAWWRERVAFDPSSRRDSAGHHQIPMVGRSAELGQLVRAFERVRSGETGSAAIWLQGEPGSGKSRLVSEFVQRMRQREPAPLYLYGRAQEFLEERPGLPVRTLLRRWLHLPRHTAPGARERALLSELVPADTAEALFRSLDPADESVAGIAEPIALSEWLVRLATQTPLVVFLDDMNFAGEVSLSILGRVADRLSESRMLLILGMRSGVATRESTLLASLRERLEAHVDVGSIMLGPLAEDDLLELVESLFDSSTPRLRLARIMHARSSGSPGVVAEMLRGLQAHGQVRKKRRDERRFELLVPPDELPLPTSVARMLEERFDELAPRRRLWLQRLAAVGGHIDRSFLAQAFPRARKSEIDAILAGFVNDGWLVPIGGRYRFARPAQREAVYATIPPHRRRRIHAAAARALEGAAGAPASAGVQFQRAYHLREAGEHAELLSVIEPLTRDETRGHPSRVHTLATWGLEAIDGLEALGRAIPEPRGTQLAVDLLEAAADTADRLGDRKAQRELLDRLSDRDFDAEREPEVAGRVYHLHGRYAANTGQYGLSRGMLRNAALLFERAGAHALEAESTLRLAHVQGHVGELIEAERLARRALELAPRPEQRARAHLALAVVALVRDEFEAGLQLVDRSMQVLRHMDDPTGGRGALAAAYLLRARIYRLVGRPRRAFVATQRAVRLARRAGERRLEAEIGARLGRLYLDIDRPRDAELELREALLTCQEIEYRRGQALASVFLGILLAEARDPSAPAILERASVLARELGLARAEALSLALRARVAREAGDTTTAGRLSARALERFEKFGGELADRIVVVATRALMVDEEGRQNEARAMIQGLARRIRRVNERIRSPVLRQRHHRASTELLASARSPAGPVFPRMALPNLPALPDPE